MKNKGFTLIELIGTIVILSLLLLIISPVVTRSIKNGVKQADDQAKANIELAAKNWASDNKDLLPKEQNNSYNIKVSDMINQGYLDDDIKLPGNDTLETVCVKIKKTNGNDAIKHVYEYTYSNSGC